MGFLRQVSRANAPSSVLKHYDRLFPGRDPVDEPGTSTGSVGDWWTTLALVPDLLETFREQCKLLHRDDRALSGQLREIATIRTGFVCGSQFVFSQHCKAGRSEGLSQEIIRAVPTWQLEEVFDDEQRAVLSWCDEILNAGRTQHQTLVRLRSHLPDEAICELAMVVSLYQMHSTLTRALHLEFDRLDERIVEVPAPPGFENADVMRLIGGE
jgi:alkylhydroperoxidase family enzyme